MGKGYAERWVLPGASRVWTAMGNRSTHACSYRHKICRSLIRKGGQASDTAHQVSALKPTTNQKGPGMKTADPRAQLS
jgi:hypothetical protein